MRLNAKHLLLIVIFLWMAGILHAQGTTVALPPATQHVANVSWTAPSACNSTTPCTFVVYRNTGTCPATLVGSTGWTLIATTAAQVGSYVDSSVTAGTTYAYAIYSQQGTTLSPPACGSGAIPNGLAPVTNVTVSGQ